MGRKVRNWTPVKVDNIPVASHRYKWSGVVDANGNPMEDMFLANSYSEARDRIPYKEGEVVYIEQNDRAVKALIHYRGIERNSFGDLREWYKVSTETKTGLFSKMWEYTYAGFIQRGYKRAGLAPDLPC